jgi:hypothetical protein
LAADGVGHSLVPLESALANEPDGSLDYGGNWRRSTYIGGSPGADDTIVTTVVLNEFMANTDYSDPLYPQHDSNDWIELYNTTDSVITLHSDWYLSDDIDDLKKWAIPSTVIVAHGRVSFDEVTGFHNPVSVGFGLDQAGEEVVLSYLPGTSWDRVVDCVRFKGQERDVSLGRWPDGGTYWHRQSPSRDSANTDPVHDLVIDEIMYHPAVGTDQEYDFIELYNPTANPIDMGSAPNMWRLKGVDFSQFPPGMLIPSGGRLVIVSFNPYIDIYRLSDFINTYNVRWLTTGVDIVGPWYGNLSNSGDRISLEKVQYPEKPGEPYSWVIVDEAIYFDRAPWPESPDGTGESLRRIHSDQYHSGNDPENWEGAKPSPGDPNWAPPPPPPPPGT